MSKYCKHAAGLCINALRLYAALHAQQRGSSSLQGTFGSLLWQACSHEVLCRSFIALLTWSLSVLVTSLRWSTCRMLHSLSRHKQTQILRIFGFAACPAQLGSAVACSLGLAYTHFTIFILPGPWLCAGPYMHSGSMAGVMTFSVGSHTVHFSSKLVHRRACGKHWV